MIDKTGDGQDGLVYFGRSVQDETCDSVYPPLAIDLALATKKEVVITSFTATHATGTYELTGSDGKYVRGTFDVDVCSTERGSGPNICE